MSRRLAILGAIALVLIVGGVVGRFVHRSRIERDFDRGMETLRELALERRAGRRVWEPRFEALSERLRSSRGFDELVDSIYRPHVAWGSEAPRELDDFETAWIEAAWSEFTGLESTLKALRQIPPDELEWHGETVKLHILRECVNVLCARAWQAVIRDEHSMAARLYGDALRLARGTDNGTILALLVNQSCTLTVLNSARSALAFGLSAVRLRSELAPLLADWKYAPEKAERRIRRDLEWFASPGELGDEPPFEGFDTPERLPLLVRDVEQGLAVARQPIDATPWILGYPQSPIGELWTLPTRNLHALHAQSQVALSALAVAAYREARGKWPASLTELDDLPTEQTLDTVTGKPLPYSIDGNEARIGPASWGEHIERVEDLDHSPYVWILLPHPEQ